VRGRRPAGNVTGGGRAVGGGRAGIVAARGKTCGRLLLASVRGHPRHVVLFGLGAGLALGPGSPAATLAAALLVGLAGRGTVALLAVAAVLGGAVLADARLDALDAGSLRAMTGQRWEGTAVLLEPVRRHGAHASARVRLAGLGEQAVARLDARPTRPEVGAVVALAGRVAPLGKYDAFQARRGAHAAVEVDRFAATGAWRGGVAGALDRVRRRAEAGLARGLPREEASLLRGMVLGQDERLTEAVRTDFQRSGLAHLLAVSGQNVVLLAMLALGVGMVVGVRLRARLAVALLLVLVYVPLAGGGPSIQRAGVMGAAGLVAALAGRPASRWYALGLAVVVTLALNPRASGEVGWQLSFAAVVGLLALAPRWREALRRARLPGPVADAVAVTAAATVATAPLMALYFQQVSIASLPANLAAAPAVAPVMWLGMLGIAAAQVSPVLCVPLNALNGPLLAYVEWVAHVAAQPPAAAVPVRIGGPVGLALTYAAGGAVLWGVAKAWAWFAGAKGGEDGRRAGAGEGRLSEAEGHRLARAARLRRRAPRLAAAAAVLVAAALVFAPALRGAEAPPPGELVVSFLDVGQGDATLLQHGGASILVDTGPPGGPILQRLRESGVTRLDALLITHAEADHEGMALDVIREFRPRLILDGGAGWPTHVQRGLPRTAVAAHAGQQLQLGEIRLQVLWPPPPPPDWRPDGNPNLRAVVAIASVGSFDVLLPADAESEVTNPLELPDVEALKVAHHGSEDPGLPALLARTKPEVAAIEVGRENTYGHPTPTTLAALRAVVPTVLRTDRDGTSRLRVSGGNVRIEP
jgi:competence protein ComEC